MAWRGRTAPARGPRRSARRRGIVDRVARCRPASRSGSARGGRRLRAAVPAEQSVERAAQRGRADRVEPALARRAAAPANRRAGASKRVVGQIGDRRIVRRGEGGAGAQRAGRLAPGQQREAMRGAPPSSRRGFDRRLRSGCGSGPADSRIAPSRRPVRARDAAVAGSKRTSLPASRSGRRTGASTSARVDRRGGEDARARRRARDLGDRQPFAAGERRGGIEPEAAPADRLPMLAGWNRGGATGGRERRARRALERRSLRRGRAGAGEQLAPSAPASPRAASARWPGRSRQRRRRSSRSGSLPPSPRSVSSTAASAADRAEAARRAPRSACGRGAAAAAARRWRGHARSAARPRRARRAAAAGRAPRRARRRAADRARAGARVGHAPERAVSSRPTGRPRGFRAGRARAGRRSPLPPTGGWRRPGACRAARPARWVDRGLAGALGDQPGQARGAVVARAAREAAIDDDADAVERQAGLGDRGREDQLARARRGRGDRGALRGGIELPCRRWSTTSGGRVPSASAVRSISATPGRKASSEPSMLASARRIAAAICGSIRCAGVAAEWTQGQRMARPSLSITGGSPSSAREALAVERRRHRDEPQVGPQRRRRVERQREPEIAVEAALVHFVEQHAPRRRPARDRPGAATGRCRGSWRSGGSPCRPCCRAGWHSRSSRPAVSPSSRAMRSAAARAARRRGTSSRICPSHHGSASSAGATRVVLPAPGGATSTARGPSRKRGEQVGQDGVDRERGRRHSARKLAKLALRRRETRPFTGFADRHRKQMARGCRNCIQRLWQIRRK